MKANFVLCVSNQDYEASLECFKVYRCKDDTNAEKHHQLRVIDESGEDYLYPEKIFVSISLPKIAREALMVKPH